MKSSIMASAVDCFHDDSDDESNDAISDVEWSKLKSSHLKEGFRDGYSAGQEAVLQEAFNEGFSHQVKLDAQDAVYKGIVTALKTYSERVKQSSRPGVNIELIEDIESRADSLLVQLDTATKNKSADQQIASEAKVTNTQTNSGGKGEKFADLKDNLSENIPRDGKNTTSCCGDSNPSGCQCLQHASEGVTSHGKTDNSSVGSVKTNCAGGACCKSTHPQENVYVSGVPDGGRASESTACCKGTQERDFTELNPSGKLSQASQSEGEVENVGTEVNQEVSMMDISQKCRHLLIELNMDQILDVLKLD